MTARGVVWGTNANPTVSLSTNPTDGTGTGSFTSSITGLSMGITYYYRAYATNSLGTAYGTEMSFTTPALPTVTTTTAGSITGTGASSGGNVTSDGGASVTARGVVWGTSANPTVSLSTKTTDGTGTGSFTSAITGLSQATTYYYRAYATNSAGTAYGTELQFTTLALPTVTTTTAGSITATGASSGGNVTSDGGSAVTARGVVWGTASGPTIDQSWRTGSGTGSGTFTTNISGLSGNTTYYYRAFATNSVGTAYGTELQFTTTAQTLPAISYASTNVSLAVGTATNMTLTNTGGMPDLVQVSKLAGSTNGYADGTGSSAKFSYPNAVAVDGSGNLYVAEHGNDRIRKVTPSGVVTTLAGPISGVTPAHGYVDANGPSARFNDPYGIAVDGSGNVYVADKSNNVIRKISPAGDVTTLAGDGTMGSTDAIGTSARFNNPISVAVDGSGNVYVGDHGSNRIRKITISGTPAIATVTTLAGGSVFSGYVDATGTSARFYNPWGVAVESSGNVYVADHQNQRIRKVSPAGLVTTLAGPGAGCPWLLVLPTVRVRPPDSVCQPVLRWTAVGMYTWWR